MTRGGRPRIARRLVTATAMVALGIAVVGGGVAFAGDGAGTDAPSVIVPGVVSDYPVGTPTVQLPPASPGTQGPVMSTASVWEWT